MAYGLSMRAKRNVNISRVVAKVVATLISLYAGGVIVNTLGTVMNKTESPFYRGLELIGWTVGGYPRFASGGAADWAANCAGTVNASTATQQNLGGNCITSVSGSGILAVVGIVGLASIVTEFVEFNMK